MEERKPGAPAARNLDGAVKRTGFAPWGWLGRRCERRSVRISGLEGKPDARPWTCRLSRRGASSQLPLLTASCANRAGLTGRLGRPNVREARSRGGGGPANVRPRRRISGRAHTWVPYFYASGRYNARTRELKRTASNSNAALKTVAGGPIVRGLALAGLGVTGCQKASNEQVSALAPGSVVQVRTLLDRAAPPEFRSRLAANHNETFVG